MDTFNTQHISVCLFLEGATMWDGLSWVGTFGWREIDREIWRELVFKCLGFRFYSFLYSALVALFV